MKLSIFLKSCEIFSKNKNVLLCMTWMFAIFFIFNSFYVTGHLYHVKVLFICSAGCPIAGWLTDVYIGRYQFIHCSLTVTWSRIIATNVYYLIDEHFFKFPSAAQTSLQVVLMIVIGLGLAVFSQHQLCNIYDLPQSCLCF